MFVSVCNCRFSRNTNNLVVAGAGHMVVSKHMVVYVSITLAVAGAGHVVVSKHMVVDVSMTLVVAGARHMVAPKHMVVYPVVVITWVPRTCAVTCADDMWTHMSCGRDMWSNMCGPHVAGHVLKSGVGLLLSASASSSDFQLLLTLSGAYLPLKKSQQTVSGHSERPI